MSHITFKLQTSESSNFKKDGGKDRINHSGFHGETCKYALDIMLSNKVTKCHSSQGLNIICCDIKIQIFCQERRTNK
jgi:hypothetical protein